MPTPPTPPTSKPTAHADVAGGSRPTTGKKSKLPGVEHIATPKDMDHVDAKDGFVSLTVPKEYGTIEGLQPDGSRKTFQTGERATIPTRQARDLNLIDEDGELVENPGARKAPTQSYGQDNRSQQQKDDAEVEEAGRSRS